MSQPIFVHEYYYKELTKCAYSFHSNYTNACKNNYHKTKFIPMSQSQSDCYVKCSKPILAFIDIKYIHFIDTGIIPSSLFTMIIKNDKFYIE